MLDPIRVSQKTKSADCLSARLLSFLVFLSTDLGLLRKSVFVLFVSQITVKSVCLSINFFCRISALLPPEKGMKGHIRHTTAPSSRKCLRSYHRRHLDIYGVLSMLPVHHLLALISSYLSGKKRFLLSKLNTITCLTITLKWSIAMMEIFLSLEKYPALCKLKLLGAL